MKPVSVDPEELRRALMSAGAVAVGFAELGEVESGVWEEFERWLAAGNNAGMAYMANHAAIRRNPALLLDPPAENGSNNDSDGSSSTATGSVISLAFRYPANPEYRPGALRFARYALGDDYHEVLRERLQPVCRRLNDAGWRTRICVDSAPILERYWAVRAGLGFIGRNRQLIIPGIGSYLFLAEIITDLPLPPDTPCKGACPPDCDACLRACPHGALGETARDKSALGETARAEGIKPAGLDARRCLSYLTIEHRGASLPFTLAANRPYGCDICQEACPFNREAAETAEAGASDAKAVVLPEFRPRPGLLALTAAEAAALDQPAFSALFRHSPVKRAKLAGLLRNLGASQGAIPDFFKKKGRNSL